MNLADIYDSSIMQRALLEAVLVGALCGAVGVHVVLRRLPFLTVTVAHATFPGVVIATILGASVLVGALGFAAVLVLAVWVTRLDERLDASTTIGVALAGSFGLGAMLQSTQSGFTRDLTAILVGQILGVTTTDIVLTAVTGAVVIGVAVLLHKELVLSAFDPTEARLQGHDRLVDLAALSMVAATVVVTVPAVGTVLAVALMTVPAMSARLVTRQVVPAMVAGAAYGIAAGAIGLTVSAEYDVAAGASIVLSSAALFVLTVLGRAAVRAPRRRALRAAAPA